MCTDTEKLKSLVLAVQNGEADAFDSLYAQSVDYAYGVVSLYLKNRQDIEDVLQNVFLRVYNGIGNLHAAENYKSWLARIARNECIRHIEKDGKRRDAWERLTEELDPEQENAQFSLTDREDLIREVQKIIDSLPDTYRESIVLYYFDRYSISEIAEYVGVPEGTIKSRLHSGRKKLQQKLDKIIRDDETLYSVGIVPLLLAFFTHTVQHSTVPTAIKGSVWGAVSGSAVSAAAAGTAAVGTTAGTAAGTAAAGTTAGTAAAGTAVGTAAAGTAVGTAAVSSAVGTATAAAVPLAVKIAAVAVVACTAAGAGTAVKRAVSVPDREPTACVTEYIANTENEWKSWTTAFSGQMFSESTEAVSAHTEPDTQGNRPAQESNPPSVSVTQAAQHTVQDVTQTTAAHTLSNAKSVTTAQTTAKPAESSAAATTAATTKVSQTQTTTQTAANSTASAAAENTTASPGADGGSYAASNGVLNGYSGSETALVLPQAVDGQAVTAVGARVFSGNSEVQTVTVPSSVTTIGQMAFSDCNNLRSVHLSDGLQTIEIGAFSGCSALSSVTLPNTVSKIGVEAFADCTSLQTIIIPSSVTSIDADAFDGCEALTVRCTQGSAAHAYAVENGLRYQWI